MSDNPTNQDFLTMWKRSMDQSVEAWRSLVGQPQTPDLFQFWKPLFGQGTDIWSQMLTQGAKSPDVLSHWKKFMDESIEAWSKVLGQSMETEAFAAAMGKFLEQYLNVVGPVRKGLHSSNEDFLRTMNLPSRKQVTDLAGQVISLETRLEPLEEQIEKLGDSVAVNLPSRKQVTDLAGQVGSLETGLKALEKRIEALAGSISLLESFVREAGSTGKDPNAQGTKRGHTPRGASRKEV
jgi:polyhydroxyalkanoic acid synthase PhaR subunit